MVNYDLINSLAVWVPAGIFVLAPIAIIKIRKITPQVGWFRDLQMLSFIISLFVSVFFLITFPSALDGLRHRSEAAAIWSSLAIPATIIFFGIIAIVALFAIVAKYMEKRTYTKSTQNISRPPDSSSTLSK